MSCGGEFLLEEAIGQEKHHTHYHQALFCRGSSRSHLHELRGEVLLKEALDGDVRVAPAAAEDLPERPYPNARAQLDLLRLYLPLPA